MTRPPAILPLLALCALPLAAQDFTTEVTAGFGYRGGKVDEPVVSVGSPGVGGGDPGSSSFAYREDSTGRSLSLAATRYFGGVPEDGVTPLALLPFVARRSSLSAAVSLDAGSRDSYGLSRGAQVTIESRLTGDGSSWGGTLEGAWFARPGWALHGVLAAGSSRETQAFSSTQTPGSVVTGSSSPREDRWNGTLGVLARPTPEVAIELAALLGTAGSRTDGVSQLGPGVPSSQESDADTLGAVLSGSVLLAGRRFALEGAASYAATHGDSSYTAPPIPTGFSHAIRRAISGAGTWYFSRTVGAGLGIDYATGSTTRGVEREYPSSSERSVTWSAGARWFPRERASVSLQLSRTTTDTISPPDTSSFTRLRATDDRVTLAAAWRM